MKDPCAHCEEMMQPYLDHVLTDAEMAEAEMHLADCEQLPAPLPLRGEPPRLRAQGGRRADAAGAAGRSSRRSGSRSSSGVPRLGRGPRRLGCPPLGARHEQGHCRRLDLPVVAEVGNGVRDRELERGPSVARCACPRVGSPERGARIARWARTPCERGCSRAAHRVAAQRRAWGTRCRPKLRAGSTAPAERGTGVPRMQTRANLRRGSRRGCTSITFLAGIPGTAVEPTWSIASCVPTKWRTSSPARARNPTSHSGSHGTKLDQLSFILERHSYRPRRVSTSPGGRRSSHATSARRQRAGALVRHARPRGAGEQDRVEADAAVARGDDVAGVGTPVIVDDAVDGARVEVGPVGERDDGGLGVVGKRRETAAERGARAALPVGAVDAFHGERMRAADDDDLFRRSPSRATRPRRREDARACFCGYSCRTATRLRRPG